MTAAATLMATVLAISPVNAAPPPTYFLGGTDFTGTGTVTARDIDWLLNGNLTGAQNVAYPRSVIDMDASVAVGADAILDIVDNAEGPVRIAGVSQGALAIASAKRALMARAENDRPDAGDVVFVAIGDPSSPTGIGSRVPGLHIPIIGVTFGPAPDTPYDTIVVAREYDGLADFPDRPWNLIATLNAVAGIFYIHPISYGPDTDLAAIPAADVTETVNSLGGRTTSYFVQNDRLPLLQPLRDLGVDEGFVSAIEQPLRQVVDAGYSRNDGQRTAPETVTPARAMVSQPAENTVAGNGSDTTPDATPDTKLDATGMRSEDTDPPTRQRRSEPADTDTPTKADDPEPDKPNRCPDADDNDSADDGSADNDSASNDNNDSGAAA